MINDVPPVTNYVPWAEVYTDGFKWDTNLDYSMMYKLKDYLLHKFNLFEFG